MPNISIEDLEKNKKKIKFVVTQEEAKPYLEEAAERISKQKEIPGFRPGKAGYEVIVQQVGEMAVLEEALESIIRKSYMEALLANDLDPVGSPNVDVSKLAPENDIEFTAEITLMPAVKELADYTKLEVTSKKVAIENKDIDLALRDLQRMQTKEVRATAEDAAGDSDKIVVSMDMKKDGVSVEGGQSPNHVVFMTEDYYIPGFKEEVKGMKEGEKKTFTLPFPEDHAQKMLAGSDVEFEIEVKELFHLESPDLDDSFGKTLGMKDMSELKDRIRENLLSEKDQEELARQEREMLESLATKSSFDDIPDTLVNEEINKMTAELQRAVEAQGGEFEKYLESMKKTLADLKLDFTAQALTRIKVALAMRAVAKKADIQVEEKELDEELDRLAEQHKDNKEAKEQIFSAEYRDYMEQILRNRKVIDFLRETIVK
jgi:trigger factor